MGTERPYSLREKFDGYEYEITFQTLCELENYLKKIRLGKRIALATATHARLERDEELSVLKGEIAPAKTRNAARRHTKVEEGVVLSRQGAENGPEPDPRQVMRGACWTCRQILTIPYSMTKTDTSGPRSGDPYGECQQKGCGAKVYVTPIGTPKDEEQKDG